MTWLEMVPSRTWGLTLNRSFSVGGHLGYIGYYHDHTCACLGPFAERPGWHCDWVCHPGGLEAGYESSYWQNGKERPPGLLGKLETRHSVVCWWRFGNSSHPWAGEGIRVLYQLIIMLTSNGVAHKPTPCPWQGCIRSIPPNQIFSKWTTPSTTARNRKSPQFPFRITTF